MILRSIRLLMSLLLMLLLVLLMIPAAALAASVTQPTLALANNQTWLIIVGALVPVITYVLNHFAPWVSEPVKAFVLVLAAAIAGGLDTAITTNVFGWNAPTAQLILTAVFAALVAHHFLWKPSGISVRLGGGTNRAGQVPAAPPPPPAG